MENMPEITQWLAMISGIILPIVIAIVSIAGYIVINNKESPDNPMLAFVGLT